MNEEEIREAAASATMYTSEKARREFIESSYPSSPEDWEKIEKLAIYLEIKADNEVDRALMDGNCKYNGGFYSGL